MPPMRNRSNSRLSDEMSPTSEDYREKRKRNNEAVKKSRSKARDKTRFMETKRDDLKNENTVLQTKIGCLQSELAELKSFFIKSAEQKHGVLMEQQDLEQILQNAEDGEIDSGVHQLERRVKTLKQHQQKMQD